MRLRRSLVAASLVLGGTSVVAGPLPFACAGEGLDATLVVDTGNGEYKYCVTLDAKRVTGLHLIELASQQHGLSYSFGYQGQAVCMLAGVGSTEEECFQGGEPFWGYWHGTSSGGWSWSGSGGGSTSIEDGDVEGWSWGTGSDGSSHQQPSPTTHASVCGPEPSDDGSDKSKDDGSDKNAGGGRDKSKGGGSDKAEGGGASGGDSGVSGSASTAGSSEPDPAEAGSSAARKKGTRNEKRGAKRPDKRGRDAGRAPKEGPGVGSATPFATPSPSPSPSVAPAATSSSGGPPAAGVVGLFLAVALGFGGAWFVKRKHAAAG